MNISRRHKIQSIRKRKDIGIILKTGKKIKTKFGPVFLLYYPESEIKKAAILLKKVSGNAFLRNRIKRIIRAFIRNEYTLFGKNNRVIFLYNRQDNENVTYHHIADEYFKALNAVKEN